MTDPKPVKQPEIHIYVNGSEVLYVQTGFTLKGRIVVAFCILFGLDCDITSNEVADYISGERHHQL